MGTINFMAYFGLSRKAIDKNSFSMSMWVILGSLYAWDGV
jgi:hypothetical protein